MGLLKRLFGRPKPSDPFPTDGNGQEESGAGIQAQQAYEAEEEYSEEIRIQLGNIQGVGDREQQEDSFAVLNSSDPARQRTECG